MTSISANHGLRGEVAEWPPSGQETLTDPDRTDAGRSRER